MPAGGLPQQKRKSGVFEDPIESVPPHDMRHLMGDHECDLVPLPLAHFQQRPTHENRPTWEGNRIRLPLRRDTDTERELLLTHVRRQPAPNLRRKSCGLILLDQGIRSSKAASRSRPRRISACRESSSVPPMRSKAFLTCATFWPSLCPIVSNRVFATAHFHVAYWAAPAKLERPRKMLDPSIHLKSMSIIVAPYFTVEQAASPLMGL